VVTATEQIRAFKSDGGVLARRFVSLCVPYRIKKRVWRLLPRPFADRLLRGPSMGVRGYSRMRARI
jgi:hypothetical protein